jgi:hypothetical protein
VKEIPMGSMGILARWSALDIFQHMYLGIPSTFFLRGNHIFITTQLIFFCELKPNAKFHNPRTTPSERKVTRVEKIQEAMLGERKCCNSGHLVPSSAGKKLGVIIFGD